MPVMNCIKNGMLGKKCGVGGTCYTGLDAHKRAAAQCQAIKASQKGSKK